MNALEMTDNELYEMGIKVLTNKLGASEVPRFIRQCKLGKGDYSVDRHKLLANQPNIDTIVKRIQGRRTAREAEERARAEKFAAPQSEIRKMADIEIYEIGSRILINKLGIAGMIGFIGLCQELNGGYTRGLIKNREEAQEYIKLYTASLTFNPKIVEDYIKRGNAYSYIGEHDKAIADYDEAIKLKPNYVKAYCHRGVAYGKKREYDKAIKDYNEVIKREPNYAGAYSARGEAWLHRKEWKKARADLTFAKDSGMDIVASFYNDYENVEEFEKKNGVQLPEDIKAMLTQR